MGIKRDLLVNAWYTGGVDVIDFSRPTRLREIAYYDPARDSGTWSAYPYSGPLFKRGPGKVPIYASDGVENNAIAAGMVVYRTNKLPRPGRKGLVDHLNPQTMDHEMSMGKGHGKGKDKDHGKGRGHDRGKGRDRRPRQGPRRRRRSPPSALSGEGLADRGRPMWSPSVSFDLARVPAAIGVASAFAKPCSPP